MGAINIFKVSLFSAVKISGYGITCSFTNFPTNNPLAKEFFSLESVVLGIDSLLLEEKRNSNLFFFVYLLKKDEKKKNLLL